MTRREPLVSGEEGASCWLRSLFGRILKVRVAPKLTEATMGSPPNTGSSSECQPTESPPFRYRLQRTLLNFSPVMVSTFARMVSTRGGMGAGSHDRPE